MLVLDLNQKIEWKEIKSLSKKDDDNSSLRTVPMLGQMGCVELEMTEKKCKYLLCGGVDVSNKEYSEVYSVEINLATMTYEC